MTATDYIIRRSHGYLTPKGTSRGIQHDEFTLGQKTIASDDIGSFEACKHVLKLVMAKNVCVSVFLVGVARVSVS